MHRRVPLFLSALVALAACGGGAGGDLERGPDLVARAPAPTVATTTPAPTTEVTTTEATTSTVATASGQATGTSTPPEPPTTRPVERVVVDTAFSPFAIVEVDQSLVLHHPAARVERIGFHESGHDGARQLLATATAARAVTLETRERGTGSQTAADIVVPPDAEIRAPVTGTVKRAGGYILYCDHRDDFAVIEPDAHPGWEVKILHISGVQVRAGQRVEAGVTVVAPRPTPLPFESQVDEITAEPSWPHVHVEVVDPSIPDRPGTTSDC